jgi:dipeptide/tripeptide permease
MMTGDNDQDPQQNFQTPDDGINWENPPKKRKRPRVTSFIICLLTAAGIITYGFHEKTVIEYERNNDNFTIKLAKIKTGTITCYTRKEKTSYPVFFNLGLGFMGIILGTLVDRLSLVIEELFQFKSRYNRDIRKLFKSCFSGINLPAVAAVCLIVGVACTIGRETGFQFVDIIYILGGIGVGPLVIHALA